MKPVTDEERRDIVDRYTRGQGLDFIAFALERNRVTLKRVLREAGVKIRKKGRQASSNWGWTGVTR